MTLYESIKKATSKKKVNEDAAGSMIGARNISNGGSGKDVQKIIQGTLDVASKKDTLKAMTVIARSLGNSIYNNIAKGENGIETQIKKESLAESIKRVHGIK